VSMPNLEGQTLKGRYRIEELLGRGGMAEVYRAWDMGRQYHVAVKIMREDLAEDLEFLQRFKREARALGALSHANIVRFYSFERDDHLAFIVMDYVEGTTLRRRILEAGGQPLSLDEVLSIVQQVCAALHYAHGENVLHRDIKPGNIMIDIYGRVLVADFGIAKAADAATATTVMPGTPAYMSPEQCRSELPDVRTDVYSLGVVVYEMLAGRRPFVGDTEATTGSTREKIRWEQMHAEPPSLQRANPEVPPQVEAVVLRALAKEREERWPTPLAFWQALEEALGRRAPQVVTAPPPPSRAPAAAPPPSPRAEPPSPAPESQPVAAAPSVQRPATPGPAHRVPGRSALPPWAWVAGGVLLVAVLAMALALLGRRPIEPPTTATLMARNTPAAPAGAGTDLPAPAPTAVPSDSPTGTPTSTPSPTVTDTPSPTPTPTPTVITRRGAWVDTVVFVEEPSSDAVVTRLEAGDIDVYAYNITEPDVAARIYAAEGMAYETSYGNYDEITFNPYGPEFNDGRLNPFAVPRIREAMNWLMDRDYICQEISGGMARPRYVPINFVSKDTALLADTIAAIEFKYAHNPDLAKEVIAEEMEALGAELVAGRWRYEGQPVVLTALIRVEDERRDIGDYISNQLEYVGFAVDRQYRTSAEASPCWMRGDPTEGCFHFYTGGWVSTAISRDEGSNFGFFYTALGLPFPLWQAYENTPEFYEVSEKLWKNDFSSMEERTELMSQALAMSLEDSVRIWLKEDMAVAPHADDIKLASNLSGSIYRSWLWAQTLRREGQVGGSVTIAMPSIMTEPWNPIAGTNWVYDMMPIRGIQDSATVPDPFTGINLPMRLEKAKVFVVEGLPVEQNLDWATLEFVPEIEVPDDAWVDWDAEKQVFVTAAEKFTEVETVQSKVVVYYEEDLFDKITWHDGSPLDLADMVMFMIMQFDQAKEESAHYDGAAVYDFENFMTAFKGWRIASEEPLVIEYYADEYEMDAENNVTDLRAAYPSAYEYGQAAWHNLAPGLMADANAEAAFSYDKAEANEVEWLSYVSGPSLEILKAQLDAAEEEGFIPFEPTLGRYITNGEARTRYANLQEWYRRYGHFYIGTGPFFLQGAFPQEGTIILQRYSSYPDLASRWDRFASVPIPEVVIDGSARVTGGEEVTYDITVTRQGAPYAVDDVAMVKFLVVDADGELDFAGDGVAVEDGLWQATLGSDATRRLAAGTHRFVAIVVSRRVIVPVRETLEFSVQ
ncbi:MAG: protein kinase, partial [Anaerolineae bacterium]|nr:protein kinase [Anaerolineae bacterium]